ncbi:ADP-ribosyltransferase [Kitasatospora sp. NPDC056651]|uniref:ADP-ribosyltransferase n=1 Tax=Kitasatospora sp. NPDC056651 TaxID=3345892 RepID=UPI0036A2C5B4
MPLTPIDSFTVDHPGTDKRTVQFLWGDLTQLASTDEVDVLVVSCLPDDYTPTPGTLVGALAQAGVSVEALAQHKAADYRPLLPCWISQPVAAPGPGIRFKRILVFEPADPLADALAAAWSVFQALACFSPSTPVSVATPLVCAGTRGADPADALSALTWAAAHYGSSNTTQLSTVKVVALTQDAGSRLGPTFIAIKDDYDKVFELDLPDPYRDCVECARKHIDGTQLPASLTYRQALAVCVYTTNYYTQINGVLRQGPTGPDWRRMFPLVEAIDSGLWNMKVHAGKSLRGEHMSDARLKQQTVGHQITNTAYTSASTDKPFTGQGVNTQTTIDGKTGVEVWDYSVFRDEDEVLFHREFTYQVDTVKLVSADAWQFGVHEVVADPCGGPHDA